MVPWVTIAGAVACVVFPQHRGIIVVAGALKTILQGNGSNRVQEVDTDDVTGSEVKKVVLKWKDLRCSLLNKKGEKVRDLLDGLSGEARPGRLLAIMGPSGSGKTTLLNTLARQMPKSSKMTSSGQLLANGIPVAQSSHKQAYVRQEDIFFSQLTVRETLMMAAKLQLPSHLSEQQKEEYVDNLLQHLGLASVASSIVGDAKTRGISGGEKKRLSISCELLGNPSIIFADEPTTGLDAFQAERAMRTLRDLAREGHTVVCSIHQPRGSVFDMFDDLILLAGGQLVYSGPAGDEALGHFQEIGHSCGVHQNPAEFFADLISVDNSSDAATAESKARINSLVAAFAAKAASKGSSAAAEEGKEGQEGQGGAKAVVSSPKGPIKGLLNEFRLLLQRAWKQTTRDKATNLVRAAMNITSALIFGSVFWRMGLSQTSIQDRMGLLQVAAINTAMASLTKTLNVFPKERLIVQRERSKGSYRVGPYFLSKLAAELPIGAVFPALFGVVVYPMAGLNKSVTRFLRFLAITTVESFTASAMGLTVGCIAPSTEAAMALGPSIMTLFIVFGGYYVNADNTPAIFRWIPNVSLIRWAFEGLCVNEFKGLKFEAHKPTDVKTGEDALERLSFEKVTLGKCVLQEAKIMFFWYWCSFYLLKKKQPKFAELKLQDEELESINKVNDVEVNNSQDA